MVASRDNQKHSNNILPGIKLLSTYNKAGSKSEENKLDDLTESNRINK